MSNSKLKKGFIDPISIFSGLFLVGVLVISTLVVKNKNFSLNINEKAAVQKDDCTYGVCGSGCCSAPAPKAPKNNDSVANAQKKPVVNEPAPDPKNCGYCSGTTCVDCANGDDDKGECTNNLQCAPGSVNAPPPATIQPLTTTPINNTLEQVEVQNIQQVITAPVVINGTVVNPATNAPVDKPAVVEVKSPQTVSLQPIPTSTPIVSTSSTCSPGCPSGQSCVLIGMGYYGCQNTTGTNSITKYADSTCEGTCATNQECVHSDGGYICKTVVYVPYTPQQQSNPCPADSTYTNGTCITNQQNITNAENQIAALNQTPSTPVVTTALQDFISSLTDRFNNVNQNTGMTDIGAYGLGGGNAYVAPVPQSVITSTDPNAFSNYSQGSGYSFGAGVITAGTILGAPAAISSGSTAISEISTLAGANASLTSIAQATAAYGGATLATLPASAQAAIAYTTSALTIGGTAYATADCIASNDPTSPSCMGLVTGYQTDPVGFNQELANSANTLENGLNTIINSQTSQNIINQVRDRLDYAYTQSGMAETYSENLYSFNPFLRPKQTQDEFAAIRNVRDAYQKYGVAMKTAANNGDIDALYAIAESVGYRPIELPIGSQIEVPTVNGTKLSTLDSSNSVRIGSNNRLYVGIDQNDQIDVVDLCHDIGACVLGGKIVQNGGRIPIDTFNKVTQASVDRTFPLQILDNKNIIDYINGTAYIPDTWLFDSLLKSNGIPYNVIKYIPN